MFSVKVRVNPYPSCNTRENPKPYSTVDWSIQLCELEEAFSYPAHCSYFEIVHLHKAMKRQIVAINILLMPSMQQVISTVAMLMLMKNEQKKFAKKWC